MTGLRYSPLHVTEFCGEMQGKVQLHHETLPLISILLHFLRRWGETTCLQQPALCIHILEGQPYFWASKHSKLTNPHASNVIFIVYS